MRSLWHDLLVRHLGLTKECSSHSHLCGSSCSFDNAENYANGKVGDDAVAANKWLHLGYICDLFVLIAMFAGRGADGTGSEAVGLEARRLHSGDQGKVYF